jgi:hypothetical protein
MTPRIKYAWEDMLQSWCAWDDRLGEDCSPYGWGATQEEAAEDLEWQLEELETPTTPDRSVYAS